MTLEERALLFKIAEILAEADDGIEAIVSGPNTPPSALRVLLEKAKAPITAES